jgi:hypothetical protein
MSSRNVIPRRRRVLPLAMLNERDGAHQGMTIAARAQRLKDLPEHPLFFRIHARLVAGKSPWWAAQWVQVTVPPDDPLGRDTITRHADPRPADPRPANIVDGRLGRGRKAAKYRRR